MHWVGLGLGVGWRVAMLCVPSEVSPFGSCAACRQRSIPISQGGHDHLRRRHISSFSRVPCNDLVIKPSWVGRTGEVPCNDSALHRLIEIHQPKRAKASPRSAASARYECAVQLARPNCEFTAGGGGKRPFATNFLPCNCSTCRLALTRNCSAAAPLQIHRKI